MGHLAAKEAYRKLRERLDRFPVGAPGRTTIFEILKVIYQPEVAELASRLPLRPTSLGGIARRLGMPEEELRPRLEAMADKGLVLDLDMGGKMRYLLAPTIVGIFEFSMMRVRQDIDQKKLAGLLHLYLLEERDFADSFARSARTTPFRTLIHEPTLPENFTEVLDWEKATCLVEAASRLAVGLCHCRHVKHHVGEDCQLFRLESCLTLGAGAEYLLRHHLAREISRQEALELLAETREKGMVHIADNVQQRPSFICQCCGCCCEVLGGLKRFRLFEDTFSSNFEARPDESACTGCRKCLRACPVGAIEMIEKRHKVKGKNIRLMARVNPDLCLGCGVCALRCESDSMKMQPRPQRRIVPENTFARVLAMALEQGKLGKMLLADAEFLGAGALGAMIDAILRLGPAQQLLARDQLRSRFVDFVLRRAKSSRLPEARL